MVVIRWSRCANRSRADCTGALGGDACTDTGLGASKRSGNESQVAYGSREALQKIELFRPDVALLDIGLPEMNGYELAARLRSIQVSR